MGAPVEIVASMESIISIFLSEIRHKERSAFILCDNLIEMACKTKAQHRNHNFNMACGFHAAWNADGVKLPPNGLGLRIQDRHNTRNNMQHANAAITVDTQHCADAILDAVRVINKCWPGTSQRHFLDWIKCAMRIIYLYSSSGSPVKRQLFEDAMREVSWRGQGSRTVRINERQIELGRKIFWLHAVKEHTPLVVACLNELEIA